MCGIGGIFHPSAPAGTIALRQGLDAMNRILQHRGPDGSGNWSHPEKSVGFTHRRLSVIDLSDEAAQPMSDRLGNWIVYNGEIYNYLELRKELGEENFSTQSDTEVILFAYRKWGADCVNHLRGMFAFTIWDEKEQQLFCARDRFGIKPFYYCNIDDVFYFASEAKALVPFLDSIDTNREALSEYLVFNYTLGEKTLFEGIRQLLPGHLMIVGRDIRISRYWDVQYDVDYDHSPIWFRRRFRELLDESIDMHLRSDVPVGSYLSGGIDSSLIYRLSNQKNSACKDTFHGRFAGIDGYDESRFAEKAMEGTSGTMHTMDIQPEDFEAHIRDVIYHLDFPVAGPGSFPQYMTSKMAAEHLKVVLGGQGGDEIFGGYSRYLIAYLEQCLKAAIDGTYKNGNYLVTIESIIPNLGLLREYKPMMKNFWKEGLFDPMDERYFRLIDRSTHLGGLINWQDLDRNRVFESFKSIFNNPSNVKKEAYFDKMTHFDFKCQLPALLHVEDRMSMAHGLESRVPFLDHPLIEFAARLPADVKFRNGSMKHLIKQEFESDLPEEIINRRDKMGFPVPLKEWADGKLKGFINDILTTMAGKHRPYLQSDRVLDMMGDKEKFSRKTWSLVSLELWYEQFHDRATEWKGMKREYAK